MKRLLTALLLIPVLAGKAAPVSTSEAVPRAPSAASLKPTDAERDARLAWWREARFGMFVHWGVSSCLGGAWKGKAYGGYAEHIQRAQKIPMAVYRQEVVGKFHPTGFNADEWIRLAKETGMGYFVITAKHRDGFAMFYSKVSAYSVVKATPFARYPMKDLAEASAAGHVEATLPADLLSAMATLYPGEDVWWWVEALEAASDRVLAASTVRRLRVE